MKLISCKDQIAKISLSEQERKDIVKLINWTAESSIQGDAGFKKTDFLPIAQTFEKPKSNAPLTIAIHEQDFHKLTVLISTIIKRGADTMKIAIERNIANEIDGNLGRIHAELFNKGKAY